ncbi:MAG: hypothetical protein JXR65_09065 [Bacteroidales bacterium]|nr:hypothetical protein [Bacteroidales bacterium]
MTKDVLYKINREAEIDNKMLNEFIAKTNVHKFLFGTEMEIYYNELRKKAINFSSSTRDLDRIAKSPEEGVNSQKYKETLELNRKLTEWFTNEYDTCESRFIKYLDFKKLERDLT